MTEQWIVAANKSDVYIENQVHDSEESAIAEAQKCAEKYPLRKFFVGPSQHEFSCKLVLVQRSGEDLSVSVVNQEIDPKPVEPPMDEILASIRRIINEDKS